MLNLFCTKYARGDRPLFFVYSRKYFSRGLSPKQFFIVHFCITFYANYMAINIGSIGYNHTHEKNFIMDIPNGPGAYLFLLIKSSASFLINGKRFSVAKNSYVLLQPKTSCTYKAVKDNYIDDWFYFSMEEKDKSFLIENGIVMDQPVHLSAIEELSSLIHRIAYELFSEEPFHSEIQQNYTQIFFHQLFRVLKSKELPYPDMLSSKNEKLTYLRARIYQEPTDFKNIDDMADFMNLSRSGFQHLYTKVFGKNVMQDIIAGRVSRAKNLLKTTKFTISEIAEKCGYRTEYHFMRQFKEQTGYTPTEFRNANTWQQIEQLQK